MCTLVLSFWCTGKQSWDCLVHHNRNPHDTVTEEAHLYKRNGCKRELSDFSNRFGIVSSAAQPVTRKNAFADAFNGCYKDGTNGTWDYRYFAGFYLLLQILFFVTYMVDNVYSRATIAISLLLFSLCRPYKKNLFNILDSLWIMMYTLRTQGFSTLDVVSSVILLLYFIVYILSKILSKVQCRCFVKLKMFVDRMADEQNVQTEKMDKVVIFLIDW